MLKGATALLIAGFLIFAAVAVGEARSPQVSKLQANGTSPTTYLVTGKATGLAGAFLYEVRVTGGSLTAHVDCINPGNNNVAAQATVQAATAGSTGPFSSDKNGNFSWTLNGTVAVAGNSCPNPNWTPRITSYSGNAILSFSDVTGGGSIPIQSGLVVSVHFP